jgi:hypothetical protein
VTQSIIRSTDLRVKTRCGCLRLFPFPPNHTFSIQVQPAVHQARPIGFNWPKHAEADLKLFAVNRSSRAGRQSKFRAGHQRPLLAGTSHSEPPGDGPLCVTLLTLAGRVRINEGETGEGDASSARNKNCPRRTVPFMGVGGTSRSELASCLDRNHQRNSSDYPDKKSPSPKDEGFWVRLMRGLFGSSGSFNRNFEYPARANRTQRVESVDPGSGTFR